MDGAETGRCYEDLVGFSEIVVALVGCHYLAVAFCAFGFHFGGFMWCGFGLCSEIWVFNVQDVSLLVFGLWYSSVLVGFRYNGRCLRSSMIYATALTFELRFGEVTFFAISCYLETEVIPSVSRHQAFRHQPREE